ncbi:DUF7556 family protein [Halorubrum sp. FL23]|uniref:DUF7556 family protein n=1 Tax=Halorubrum sp. FL23 TaxID=3458704 RepID=UPI0040343516
MYITNGSDHDADIAPSVMGAFDGDRFVIADLERDDRWLSVSRAVAADLEDTR